MENLFDWTDLCSSIKSAEKDWEDIKFGVENKVDFYALSFVKDAEVVHELKAFLKGTTFMFSFLVYSYNVAQFHRVGMDAWCMVLLIFSIVCLSF